MRMWLTNIAAYSLVTELILLLLLQLSVSPMRSLKFTDLVNCVTADTNPTINPRAFLFKEKDAKAFFGAFNATAMNARFLRENDEFKLPDGIVRVLEEKEVPSVVRCAAHLNYSVRVRSGGWDSEGSSYVSQGHTQFFVLDLYNLRSVVVNINDDEEDGPGDVVVAPGATTGEVYYKVWDERKTLTVPLGISTTLGIGGSVTAGLIGALVRRYGLASDFGDEVKIVDRDGRVYGKDILASWSEAAIRGGGGGNFGVILSWKLRLVEVPETVTVFTAERSSDKDGNKGFCVYQRVAPFLDEKLFIKAVTRMAPSNSKSGVVTITYTGLYLGRAQEMLLYISKSFPELMLNPKECTETDWINSVLYMAGFPPKTPPNSLLNPQPPAVKKAFKDKTDFLRIAMWEDKIEKLWDMLAKDRSGSIIWIPLGGAMNRSKPLSSSFPHTSEWDGCSFFIQYHVEWNKEEDPKPHLSWISSLHDLMTRFVTKSPRQAYVAYKDFDLGTKANATDNHNTGAFLAAYYKDDFTIRGLVRAKNQLDPTDVFNYEQSIEPDRSVT